jgi:hypothetical protein
MKNLIIGIDPGAGGGFAEIWPDGRVNCYPMFDEPDMRDYVATVVRQPFMENRPVVYLEQVGGFIGDPSKSRGSAMFNFGSGYGFIRGLLSANLVTYKLVVPRTWQKGIPGVQGIKGPARKRALKEHAARLFPNVKVTLSTADALLIADYGKKQEA